MRKLLICLLFFLSLTGAGCAETLRDGPFEYELTEEGAVLTEWDFCGLTTIPEVVEIPAELDGHPVVGIASNSLNTSNMTGDHVFTLVIPEGVKWLAEDAFLCCHNAEKIVFPASLTEIPEGCFSHVSAELAVAEGNPRYQVQDGFLIDVTTGTLLYDSPAARGKQLPAVRRYGSGCLYSWFTEWGQDAVIPEDVEEIGAYAFYDWELAHLTLPESLRLIETAAFECVDITSGHVTVPHGVERIEFGAFGLYSYPGGELVVDIGPRTHLETAAEYDARMGEVWASGGDELADPTYRQGEFSFRLTDAGAVLDAWQPAVPAGDTLTIPSLLGGQPVVGVNDCALTETRWFDDVTVTLPEGLKWLHADAFGDCWQVDAITLPSTLESIPEGCFYIMEAEITLHPDNPFFTNEDGFLVDTRTGTLLYASNSARGKELPAVRRLGKGSTYTWVTGWGEMDVVIPEGVEEISSFAFYDGAAKSLTLPESLRLIETCAFEAFDVMELPILIPVGVEELQYGAFGLSYQVGEWGLYEDPDMIIELGSSTRCESYEEYVLRTGDTSWEVD